MGEIGATRHPRRGTFQTSLDEVCGDASRHPPTRIAMNPPLRKTVDLSALSTLATEVATTVASVGGDIALVIGHDGVIRNVAEGAGPLAGSMTDWVGRPWTETVTVETRRKVELLMQEVLTGGVARRREVNHTSASGVQIPVAYSAVQLGAQGPVLAVGRDLSTVAAIQQRFLEAQQDLERDYWQRRQADTRFRLLFQVLNDAVLLVDATTFEVLEANAAAESLFAAAPQGLLRAHLPDCVEAHSRAALSELLSTTRTLGRPGELRVRPQGPGLPVEVSATPFRSEHQQLLLVRARDTHTGSPSRPLQDESRRLVDFVQHTPDGVVITDTTGRVLMANPAFAAMCGAHGEKDLRGRALDELFGDTLGQWTHLLNRARQRGIAVQEVLSIHTEDGQASVDASAAMLAEGDQECVGFSLRLLRQGSPLIATLDASLVSALAQLTQQVGRLPLADMLSEVQFIAERHLVSRALEVADGHVERAARALGLTVDGLELRMRRHRLSPASHSPDKPLLN